MSFCRPIQTCCTAIYIRKKEREEKKEVQGPPLLVRNKKRGEGSDGTVIKSPLHIRLWPGERRENFEEKVS